jgi:UDP-3-O-[3-hydroxymyristoyl] glucosamine N-acyltransferase
MNHPGFFDLAGPFTVAELAALTQSDIHGGGAEASSRPLEGVQPLTEARPRHVSFLDNKKYLVHLGATQAGACFVSPKFADRMPAGTVALVNKAPYRAFAQTLAAFYPDAMRSKVAAGGSRELIDPTAVLEEGVVIEPGAIIGPQATIGRGTRIAAGAVIGYRVAIGRDCYIGPVASVIHALVGDRVIIHAGARIGEDGFGFAMSAQGHLKVPQVGRVILQDDVDIGANTAIDRGALKDTIIGEGTKIDNMVQIGHNVVIGRHCVIVGQVGIAGSAELGDFVVMGGQSGLIGHIKIGSGAQIAGGAHPKDDVPANAVVAGTPARPFKQWAREIAAVSRLARRPSDRDEPGANND